MDKKPGFLAEKWERLSLWALRKCMRLWFSRHRQEILVPFMRTPLFKSVFHSAPDAPPNIAQVLFQRLLVAALRGPKVLLPLFRHSLRVCLTYRCNLACKACYARGLQEEVGRTDMSVEDYDKLSDYFLARNWRRVRFLGGEPTIHSRFGDILDICYRKGIEISMPTNNLFAPEVARKLNPRYVRDLAINYSAYLGGTAEQKRRFRENLDYVRDHGIPFSFSYILKADGIDEGLESLYEDLEKYIPMYIRVSLELPAFSDEKFKFGLAEAGKTVFDRVHAMQLRCAKLYVPFYIYRPMPLCLFSGEQERKLGYYSKFTFFTRCPLSYAAGQGYGMLVTVNPDLTVFPCASVFIKGPSILEFENRRAIHDYYAEKLKPLLAAPLNKAACGGCEHHEKFLATVVDRSNPLAPALFNDRDICQGGCVSLRCHEGPEHGCRHE
jgi:pyruvate-formate lyase-activating enzyme